MTDNEFEKIHEMSTRGADMVSKLLQSVTLKESDCEYIRHMIEHIVHNERMDAAVKCVEVFNKHDIM